MSRANELRNAMAVLEMSFVDSIREHTNHENPKILEPYDVWNLDGSKMLWFEGDEEIEAAIAEISNLMDKVKNVLVYCAESKRSHGYMALSEFLKNDREKVLGIDESDGRVWGVTSADIDKAKTIDDNGFWGFFQGDDEGYYFFSRGRFQFAVDRVQLKS